MKKTITPLTLCLMMLLSLQSFAQNDSSRTSPIIKLVADSSFNANDTISIGNMIIVKKQGYQDNRIENNSWYNKKRSITHGNRVVVNRPAYQNQYNNRRNRNRNMPIGITRKKIIHPNANLKNPPRQSTFSPTFLQSCYQCVQ
jgi:hypothetical protein